MATRDDNPQKVEQRSLAVRKAAAKAAVAASEKTGRPVDPRVKKLAEIADPRDLGGQVPLGRQAVAVVADKRFESPELQRVWAQSGVSREARSPR